MKLKDVKLIKPNPVAKFSKRSGAGTHKTDKDYSRKDKHKKDLRRIEEAKEAEEVTITLKVRGDAKKRLAELLDGVSYFCAIGASRSWGILDGDKGEGPKVFFDGDGADKVSDVKINGQPVKELVK